MHYAVECNVSKRLSLQSGKLFGQRLKEVLRKSSSAALAPAAALCKLCCLCYFFPSQPIFNKYYYNDKA